jgi:hypothetical protein
MLFFDQNNVCQPAAMKPLIKKYAVLPTLFGTAGVAAAGTATPLNISSGYNEDGYASVSPPEIICL